MTNVAPISRKKDSKTSNNKIISFSTPEILNKIEDYNNIVVMSGTATRKSLEKKDNHLEVKRLSKNNFKDSFLKLRAPFYKPHHKQAHTEEKLLTKSCEILLEWIKPYKDIRVAKKTKVTESIRIGSVLKSADLSPMIIYERKATRKVHFFSFSEENQTQSLFNMNPLGLLQTSSGECENESMEVNEETETSPNSTIKTASSEDFITKVFPQAETTALI